MEKDLTSYPFSEQKRMLKENFEVKLNESDKLYIGLLEANAINDKNAIKAEINKTVKEGLKFKHLAKTKDNKIYLTELGQTITKGTKKLFY